MVEQRKCTSCGAPLVIEGSPQFKRWRCEYCGAVYVNKGERDHYHFVEVCPAPVCRLYAEKRIPHYIREGINADDISNYTIEELTHQLAEGLAACMKVDVREDPTMKATIIRGEVRVIPPDFRFGE